MSSLHETGVTTRPLRTHAERVTAVRLYRDVFDYAATDPAVSPKLLTALERYGGSAVGAFDASGEIIGFTYGFIGAEGGEFFHYSQAAVVAARAQGLGVGRALKYRQADLAREQGLTAMRWAYDPMLARNAHFNLDVLGARGRWLVEDFYGQADDAGRSDRIIVEWRLDQPSTQIAREFLGAAPDLGWGSGCAIAEGRILAVPADWRTVTNPATAATLRNRVAEELQQGLHQGLELVSCRRSEVEPSTSIYLLQPRREDR